MIKVALEALGCKLNQAEIETMAGQFARVGYKIVPLSEKPDVYVLNSCTVTGIADRKSRHLIRMAHRNNPDALIVVTGCYAERAQSDLAKIDGVSLVLGNNEKQDILYILESRGLIGKQALNNDGEIASSRTRAMLKIQDGCSNFCTFCIVPYVRGVEKSIPAENIIFEITNRIALGYKEIVLTGTEIGSYNQNGVDLVGLLKRVLTETKIERLRLSSLQPQEITPELISFWKNDRLCRHFHLSLQSGSEDVLRRMGRHYSLSDYSRAVSLIRSEIPDVAVTTDVIVGFPGETEAEYRESYDFCEQIGFARIHVFQYSPREGTTAAAMPLQLKENIKKERSRSVLALAKQSAGKFVRQFIGKNADVLFEAKSGGFWIGHTDNYLKVYIRSDLDLLNKINTVKLTAEKADGLTGEIESVKC